MNKLLKMGIGLAALGLTVYVAGVAWKRSQGKKNGAAGFAGAAGGSRLSQIAKAGGFRNADGFADADGFRDAAGPREDRLRAMTKRLRGQG
jgi:hypothetical protein